MSFGEDAEQGAAVQLPKASPRASSGLGNDIALINAAGQGHADTYIAARSFSDADGQVRP
jgi:hypothetical protein